MTLPAVGLLWGEGRGSGLARFWVAQATASDDGVPWTLAMETNDAALAGLGGEALFTMAFVTVRAAASAVLQFTPILNDDATLSRTVNGATVRVLQPRFTVPQGAGTPAAMLTQTFEVPLLLAQERGGVRQFVTAPRGERLRLRIESIGQLGNGTFRLESCELEYQILRRSRTAPMTVP